MKSLLLSTALTLCTALAVASDAPRELDWLELMPKDEVELLNQSPAISHDGTFRMEQQGSFRTIAELDKQHVKLPGYIVPVDISDDQKMSSFFLVPYFGACIHVPPPPSNQIVHVRSSGGIKLRDLYQPFWISGTIQVEHMENELANAGYRIDAASVEPYVY